MRPPAPPRPKHITELFAGPIEPVRVSVAYQAGLLITAVVMVLIPLLYVALIGVVGWAAYLHAVNDISMLNPDRGFVRGRGYIVLLLLYATPIVAGATLILFMVKPLFARGVKRVNPYNLEPGQEPLLYSFVEAVAKAIGAPTPTVIEVDCEVNASAGFRRGIWSMFSNDLILTLGMPLVAGLNTRQLAGVLAHELGHFSQFFGMRLTYLIRRINGWLARVVYERDTWDEKLVELSEENESGWLTIMFLLTRLCVWLSRGILWVFMIIGHGVSSFMLRQMEYNADRYEARLAGSECFRDTMARMGELSAAFGYVISNLRDANAKGQLSDDAPATMVDALTRMPPDVRTSIKKSLASTKTSPFASHPASGSRIASAMREAAPGVFTVEKPSANLFRNFELTCKWVTVALYQGWLGPRVDISRLVPASRVKKEEQVAEGGRAAVNRYFQGAWSPIKPLFPDRDVLNGSLDADTDQRRMIAGREAMVKLAPILRAAKKKIHEAQDGLDRSHGARMLLAGGVKSFQAVHKLSQLNPATLDAHEQTQRNQMDSTQDAVRKFHHAASVRLSSALRLLRNADAPPAFRLAANIQQHVMGLLESLRALELSHDRAMTIQRSGGSLAMMLMALAEQQGGESCLKKSKGLSRELHTELNALRGSLQDTAYPMKRSEQQLSMGQFLVPTSPPGDDFGGMIEAASDARDRYFNTLMEVTGRLALIGEKIEKAAGLPPLEPPSVEETLGSNKQN